LLDETVYCSSRPHLGGEMLESVAIGLAASLLFTIVAGIRRWPWRWCAITGLGFGLVLAILRFSHLDVAPDPSVGVLLGAIGGSIAAIGSERGERERRKRSDAILGRTASTIP
jgi:hypothetical protein